MTYIIEAYHLRVDPDHGVQPHYALVYSPLEHQVYQADFAPDGSLEQLAVLGVQMELYGPERIGDAIRAFEFKRLGRAIQGPCPYELETLDSQEIVRRAVDYAEQTYPE